MLPLREPFCDYLRVTVPYEVSARVVDEFRPFLDMVGCAEVAPGLCRIGAEGGVFKHGKSGAVAVYVMSGQLLAIWRDVGLLQDAVLLLSGYPSRVTRLDATCDFLEDAPPIVARLYKRAMAGELSLSRKRITPSNAEVRLSAGHDGRQTGTLYLGRRGKADVVAVVYDKRWERISKGCSDPGLLLRVEIRCSAGVGCVLGDVLAPERLFYHFAAPDLVEAPSGVSEWKPHAEGFYLSKRREFTAAERMGHLVDGSADIGRAIALSLEACGDLSVLERSLRARGRRVAAGMRSSMPSGV